MSLNRLKEIDKIMLEVRRMFDKEGIKKYVGATSASSYSTGLSTIERDYAPIDIDAEFEKDECKTLLKKLHEAKNEKNISPKELHKRRDNYSHLNKYTHFKRYKAFVEWFSQQPQKSDSSKLYAKPTIEAAANLLRNGLKKLSIYEYRDTDCFSISTPVEFEKLYKRCYEAATAYDKKADHSDFRNGLNFYLVFLNGMSGQKYILNHIEMKKVRLLLKIACCITKI